MLTFEERKMKDQGKTKHELIKELVALRRKANELETLKMKHKRAEQALRESEASYRLLLSAESDAIIIVDSETKKIVDANKAALTLYGYNRKEFLQLRAIEISAEPEKSTAHIEKVASGKPAVVSPGPVQRYHRKKDGTIFTVEISSGTFMLKGRKKVCGIIRDITERNLAEEALRKANEGLYKLSQDLEEKIEERTKELKDKNKQLVESERLATLGKIANRVAHELRNPLTVVGGFARRIYEKTPHDDENKKYLKLIVENVTILENKISEIIKIDYKQQ
jgi:PAS domain S-box-containing protein